MLLAEAHILRRELEQHQISLEQSLRSCRFAWEGDTERRPLYERLLERLQREGEELGQLKAAIYHTNAISMVETEKGKCTIAHALAHRDQLHFWKSTLQSIAASCEMPTLNTPNLEISRYGEKKPPASQLRYEVALGAAELLTEADAVAKELLQLTADLRAANWKVELAGYTPSEEL